MDENLGSETVRAYNHAVEQAPHLEGIAFLLDTTTPGQFAINELGLAGSPVKLNPDKNSYKEAIASGIIKARMGEFSQFFRERQILPRVGELVTSTMLHELGHADDFHSYIQRAGGDVAAAFKLSREVRNAELASLPLKGSTGSVKKAWDENIDGYRDAVKAAGVTEDAWPQMLLDNVRAYAKLPCEVVADRFALGVLATMYS